MTLSKKQKGKERKTIKKKCLLEQREYEYLSFTEAVARRFLHVSESFFDKGAGIEPAT